MRRVTIFGVGLIGGSFALALRKAGFDGEITGVSSPKTIAAATELRVIDRGVDAAYAIEHADLIYLSQPILCIVETIRSIGSYLRPGVVLTDAGSTKAKIAEAALDVVREGVFIGGHPMAGKERSGVQEADANLFQGRPYVLCPLRAGDASSEAFEELRNWIERIGARPVVLDPDRHDELVAFTSHVPQLMSTALASVLAKVENSESVAGPAVLELTRLALSPYDIWHDIFETNGKHIQNALSKLLEKLDFVAKRLDSRGLVEEFNQAAEAARSLRKSGEKR